MSITTYALVTAIGLSPEFFLFKPKHFTVTNKEITPINGIGDNDFELHTLHRFEDNIAATLDEPYTASFQTAILDIIDLIITKSKQETFSVSTDTTAAEFSAAYPYYAFSFGDIIEDSDGNVYPVSLSLSNSTETVMLYFYPPYFQTNYPNNDISVVGLLDSVDGYATVNLSTIDTLISELDNLPFHDKFAAITEDQPCTTLEVVTATWVNPSNTTESQDIPFGLVCYGYPSDEDKDQAIRDYIIDNSTLTKTIRELTFPSLFGSYGFTIFPKWDLIAIDDDADVYNPIFNPNTILAAISDNIGFLNSTHNAANYELLPTVYQSLPTVVIPDVDTLEDTGLLSSNHEDYFLAAPTDADFVSMSLNTRTFVQSLIDALSNAESFPDIIEVEGLDVENVDDYTYMVFYNNGLRYRVLTKSSYDIMIG